MKRFLLATTALLLILPDIAIAQQQPRPRPSQGVTKPARPARPTRPVARPQPARPIVKPARPIVQPVRPTRPGLGGPQIQPPRPNPGIRPPKPRPPKPRPPRPGNGHRPGIGRPPHRPGMGRPPHFRPIHRPGFHYPRGWGYRRWAIGLILPSLFLSNNYYYDDYSALGVGPPPYGYRWVRYGPDLLLVQQGSGRIADVIYGAFY